MLGMKRKINIDTWIEAATSEQEKSHIKEQVQEVLSLMNRDYALWLEYNEHPVLVQDMEGLGGAYNPNVLQVGLAKNLFQKPPSAVRATFQEETVHMIDHHLKFSEQPAFVDAAERASERPIAKMALALSRIWCEDRHIKAMPVDDIYSTKRHTALEMLPDVLLCRDMLQQLYLIDKPEERPTNLYTKLETTIKWSFSGNDEADAHLLHMCTGIIFVDKTIKTAKEFDALVDRIRLEQSELCQQLSEYKDIILKNPDNLSVDEMLKQIFSNFSIQVADFQKITGELAEIFDKYPDWKIAMKDENTSRVEEILQNGISMEALQFLYPHQKSTEVMGLLRSTYNLFQLAAAKTPDISGVPNLIDSSCVDAKIDGKTPLEVAIAGGNTELAALLTTAQNQRKKEFRLPG